MLAALDTAIQLARQIDAIEEEHKRVLQGQQDGSTVDETEWDQRIAQGQVLSERLKGSAEAVFPLREQLVAQFRLPTGREGAVMRPPELEEKYWEFASIP